MKDVQRFYGRNRADPLTVFHFYILKYNIGIRAVCLKSLANSMMDTRSQGDYNNGT